MGFEDTHLKYKAPHDWSVDFRADGIEECRNHFLFINEVPNASATVFRKFAYQSVGGADESMLLCSDWKLWAAMALAGRMAYTSEPLNYYRTHGSSLRTQNFAEVRERIGKPPGSPLDSGTRDFIR